MVEIDAIDRRILFELDRNARIPEVQIAKKIGKSKEAVRYRIKKLVDSGIILRFTTWIDPIKIGYQTAKMYLHLANIPSKKKEFIEYVKKDKRLFWLGIAEGVWNVGLTFFVKSNEEFFQLKNSLFSKFKDLIIESKTASVIAIYYHNKTFLHNEKSEWKSMFDSQSFYELDGMSKKVLRSFFKNSRENIATIAHNNKTSVDIVRNRMRKLEEQRIIEKYTIILNYEKLGYEFYKTFLYFKSLNEQELFRFMKYAMENPNIINFIKQISAWDIELEIMCKSFVEYNEIISKLTEEFSKSIQKVETAIMKEDHVFPAEKMVFE